MISVLVQTDSHHYPIQIASGLLGQPTALTDFILGDSVCIVSNETVAPLYIDKLTASLSGKQIITIILPDGESYKNIDSLMQILSELLAQKATRKTTLIALGGGVVGDMSGLAASLYQRGIPYIQVPTTLLAQVDSSVGGKTAINHPLGKNMIGHFYQPQTVLIDPETLNTLPKREYHAGLAEVIKYGLIADAVFFKYLEDNISAIQTRDPNVLSYIIQRCCEIKANIVSQDEKESGIRAILNFGHTFGHAIETLTEYKQYLHGEAIAIGMMMALEYGIKNQGLDQSILIRLSNYLQALDLPCEKPANLSNEAMHEAMMRDKKNHDGKLRLVLLKKLGHAAVFTV